MRGRFLLLCKIWLRRIKRALGNRRREELDKWYDKEYGSSEIDYYTAKRKNSDKLDTLTSSYPMDDPPPIILKQRIKRALGNRHRGHRRRELDEWHDKNPSLLDKQYDEEYHTDRERIINQDITISILHTKAELQAQKLNAELEERYTQARLDILTDHHTLDGPTILNQYMLD